MLVLALVLLLLSQEAPPTTAFLVTSSTLSKARGLLAATSLSSAHENNENDGLAFFAGGTNGSQALATVDMYHHANGSWTTATLSQPRFWLAATSVAHLALFAGGIQSGMPGVQMPKVQLSATVDIFNATSCTWTNATLSVPRFNLAATSLGELAFFAGGCGVRALFFRFSPWSNVLREWNALLFLLGILEVK